MLFRVTFRVNDVPSETVVDHKTARDAWNTVAEMVPGAKVTSSRPAEEPSYTKYYVAGGAALLLLYLIFK